MIDNYDEDMTAVREAVVSAVMSVVGIVFGVLSVIGLAIAAAVPPILGLLSLLLSPLRAVAERLHRGAKA